MKRSIILGISLTLLLFDAGSSLGNSSPNTNFTDSIPSQESGFPLGKPGLIFTYTLTDDGPVPGSVVKKFTLSFGPVEERKDIRFQWLRLRPEKADGEYFTVWMLTQEYPPADLEEAETKIARYILREGEGEALEFRHPSRRKRFSPLSGPGNIYSRGQKPVFSRFRTRPLILFIWGRNINGVMWRNTVR